MSSAARSAHVSDRVGRREQASERLGLDDDALGPDLGRALLSGGSANCVPGEDQLGLGVAEVERDLALLEQHVHRHDDAAGAEHAVVGDRELGDVREHDPDPVAGLDAALLQQSGNAGAGVVELGVGEHLMVEAQGCPLAVLLRGVIRLYARFSFIGSPSLVGACGKPPAATTWRPWHGRLIRGPRLWAATKGGGRR